MTKAMLANKTTVLLTLKNLRSQKNFFKPYNNLNGVLIWK